MKKFNLLSTILMVFALFVANPSFAETSPLTSFFNFFFIAVMRLHHSVLGKGGEWQQKRARSRLHALTGSPTTGLLNYTGERAHSGRVLLTVN